MILAAEISAKVERVVLNALTAQMRRLPPDASARDILRLRRRALLSFLEKPIHLSIFRKNS